MEENKEKKENIIKRFFKKIRVFLGLSTGVLTIAVGENIAKEVVEDNKKAIEENNLFLKDEENKISQNKQTNDFLNSIKVENTKKDTRNTLDELETKEDVLRYLKNMYIEEYETITGDKTLTTNDIKIIYDSQNYEYELDNGTIVSHGKQPALTEGAIKSSGNSIKSTNRDVKYYTVYKCANSELSEQEDEIIDCIKDDSFIDINATQVIPGDKYNEMKDGYPSALKNLGPIIDYSFSLMDLMEKSENVDDYINDTKDKLSEVIDQYKTDSKIIKNNKTQDKKIEEDENELEK